MAERRDVGLQAQTEPEPWLARQRTRAVEDGEITGKRDARERVVERLFRELETLEKLVGRNLPPRGDANDIGHDSARHTVSFHEDIIP